MNRNSFSNSPYRKFEIHQINSPRKIRDSPTSSILKTPTAIFVTTRSSSAKIKKLTFSNGPVDLQTLRNGTHESNISVDSGRSTNGDKKLNNGEISFEEKIVEVAISPVKTMKVSPDTWNAFLEYKKYNDYANETEKTDYTYSRLSKYRHKEIIPGFPVRPNLSRSSLSSTRSSLSSPSGQTSMNKSYQSKNYDFTLYNHSDSEIFNDLNQSGKLGHSKYFLTSSKYDWKESDDADSLSRNYVETDFYGHSPEEKITRSYAYTTTEASEPTTPYYGKVRKMELDDADIDEIDDPSVIGQFYSENRYYTGSDSNANWGLGTAVRSQTASENFKNFFTAIFLYVTSVGTVTKDLFSKYILRRRDDHWDRSMDARRNWKNENYARSSVSRSWLPWQGKRNYYSTANYYTDGYYGRSSSWPQRIYYYFHDRFSKIRNLILSDSSANTSRYQDTSRKRKFWWFFIPFLLLVGSFLGYIDFFSNPKAILNILYNWALFIPSFLHYTVTVFIPWLIFEGIPYFVLQAVPHFVTVTLPYLFVQTVPYYFWVIVHFFADLTLTGVWNMLVGAVMFALNFLRGVAGSVYNFVLYLISSGYFLSSEYLTLFYSNFCMQVFHFLTMSADVALYFLDFVHHAFSYVSSLLL